jgi:hypothetical protein
MKEIELKPMEPHFVNGVKFKVLANDERGEGWHSPCPQLYITVQDKQVAIIGFNNIKKIRDMLDHALSNGKGIS